MPEKSVCVKFASAAPPRQRLSICVTALLRADLRKLRLGLRPFLSSSSLALTRRSIGLAAGFKRLELSETVSSVAYSACYLLPQACLVQVLQGVSSCRLGFDAKL